MPVLAIRQKVIVRFVNRAPQKQKFREIGGIMDYDVFISYASKDRPFAIALKQHLNDQGVNAWIDMDGIGVGDDWADKIGKALRPVLAMVLIYSSSSIESSNVKDELALAAKWQKVIFPIRIEDIQPDDFFEVRLARYNWVDVFERQQEKLIELASSIKKRIEQMRPPREQPSKELKINPSIIIPGASFEEKKEKVLGQLLERLQDNILLKALPFMGEKEIQTDARLRWMIKDKQGIGIRLKSRGKKSKIRWGLFSENKSRDPEFRELADKIKENGLFKEFDFFPDDKLRISFETKYYDNEDLNKPKIVEEIYQGFSDFCKKIKPFLSLPVSYDNETLPEEADKESNAAGNVQISDDPNKKLEDDAKQAAVEESISEETGEEDDGGGKSGGKRITYTSWQEFEKEQGAKDERKKNNLPIAGMIHELIVAVLKENNKKFEIRYGDGTFSFSMPREEARSGKRTFARVGLVDLAGDNLYLDTLYKGEDEAIPAGGGPWSKKDQNKYQFTMSTLEDFEKVKDSIKQGVVRSYAYLAKS